MTAKTQPAPARDYFRATGAELREWSATDPLAAAEAARAHRAKADAVAMRKAKAKARAEAEMTAAHERTMALLARLAEMDAARALEDAVA